MKKVFLFAALFSLSIALAGYGSGEKRVNLRGNWKIILGDNRNYAKPGYDDSDWESIYVPATWQEEGFRRYNGYAWYRTSFEIEFTDNEQLFLQLGRIDDADEVFVNGQLVGTTGGFPPNYFTAFNVPRSYAIPTQLLVKGKKNVIAIRVYDDGGEGGILGRDVGIYGYSSHEENGYSLVGNWKFRLSDDKQWASEKYPDSDWEDIAVPSTWEQQGFKNYDGMAWYRKHFTLPANFKNSELVILLGKIDDLDEVYINGTLVGSTGNMASRRISGEEWKRPRSYFIPDGLLKPNQDNVVAVRVFDEHGNGGIFEGPITILPSKNYKRFWENYQDEHYAYKVWSFFEW